MGAVQIIIWGSVAPKGFEGDAGLSGAVPKAACIFSMMGAISGPHTQLLHGWLFRENLEPPLSAWTTVLVSEWIRAGYGGPAATGQSMSPEAKTLECWFRSVCSEPSSAEEALWTVSQPVP